MYINGCGYALYMGQTFVRNKNLLVSGGEGQLNKNKNE